MVELTVEQLARQFWKIVTDQYEQKSCYRFSLQFKSCFLFWTLFSYNGLSTVKQKGGFYTHVVFNSTYQVLTKFYKVLVKIANQRARNKSVIEKMLLIVILRSMLFLFSRKLKLSFYKDQIHFCSIRVFLMIPKGLLSFRACLHGVGDPGLVGLVSFVFTPWGT